MTPNSLIAMGDDDTVVYDYADNPVVHVFEINNAKVIIYNLPDFVVQCLWCSETKHYTVTLHHFSAFSNVC